MELEAFLRHYPNFKGRAERLKRSGMSDGQVIHFLMNPEELDNPVDESSQKMAQEARAQTIEGHNVDVRNEGMHWEVFIDGKFIADAPNEREGIRLAENYLLKKLLGD